MDQAIPWSVNMKVQYFVYNCYNMCKNDSNFAEIKNEPSTFYIHSKWQMIYVGLEFKTTHMFVVQEQSLEWAMEHQKVEQCYRHVIWSDQMLHSLLNLADAKY
jgi:hypothetical protein